MPEPDTRGNWHDCVSNIRHVLLLLDGSSHAAQGIPMAQFICESTGAQLTLLSSDRAYEDEKGQQAEIEAYLCAVAERIHAAGIRVNANVRAGSPSEVTRDIVLEKGVDLVITSTRGRSGENNWLRGGLSDKLVHLLDIPILLVQVFESGPPESPHLGRVLVALDGSAFSEQALPYARWLGKTFDSELMLISVPAVPESEKYRAPASVIHSIRKQAETSMRMYLKSIADLLCDEGLNVRGIVTGSHPARTIVDVSKREGVDLILITSQGRGGLDRLFMGSEAQQVVQLADSPVLIVPINHE
jgi:nucleotide-binding universal stress UspA family protein